VQFFSSGVIFRQVINFEGLEFYGDTFLSPILGEAIN
jgi:hypothetical protein